MTWIDEEGEEWEEPDYETWERDQLARDEDCDDCADWHDDDDPGPDEETDDA